MLSERRYPRYLQELAAYVQQPRLPELIRRFLWDQLYGDDEHNADNVSLNQCPNVSSRIFVYHSAIARFYAPSDLCGAGGMYHERIRSTPLWQGEHERRDTALVEVNQNGAGPMHGMCPARILLFFSFIHDGQYYPCALVHWYAPVGYSVDELTGYWVVKPEFTGNGQRHLAIVHLDCIARGAHLIGVYGSSFLPDDFHFSYSLDSFRSYYVNTHVDHHMHEFLS